MNISGIGLVQSLLQYLGNNSTSGSSSTPSNDLLTDVLLNSAASKSSLYTLPSQSETFHMEIELTDGTTVTIDYASQGVQNKTSYELGQYGSYTYGTDYLTPENTANRILDFAKALWDGSPEKLETLANAMDEGARQARKSLGGIPNWIDTLISRTVDLLHQGVEDMKASSQEAA
jgi:hypothetical protein